MNGAISNNPKNSIDKDVTNFLLVCNPLTRTTKFLPSLNFTQDYLMHRDSSSGAYKIFAVMVKYRSLLHYYMYDLKLELWKQILTLKRDKIWITNLRLYSIVFNGVYYYVFGEGTHAYKSRLCVEHERGQVGSSWSKDKSRMCRLWFAVAACFSLPRCCGTEHRCTRLMK